MSANHNSKTTCILLPEQFAVLWRSSWLALFSSILAYYYRQPFLATTSFAVFSTSLNYWRKPDYSWRRYADMFCVVFSVLSHLYYAWLGSCWHRYFPLCFCACALFPLGQYYYRRGNWWCSTFAHLSLHILGNIANVVLYSKLNRN
jgi:hypothetical protein